MALDSEQRQNVRGTLEAWAESGKLWRVLRGYHVRWRNSIDFDEFCESALVRAWEAADQFRGNSEPSFAAWLKAIAFSTAVQVVRVERREQELRQCLIGKAPTSKLRAGISSAELVKWICAELNERERLVLWCRYYLEMPTNRIAGILETTPQAVYQVHYRAIGKLRKISGKKQPPLR